MQEGHVTQYPLYSAMITLTVSAPVITKILFTVAFPKARQEPTHVPPFKLHSLAKKQLSDLEVIQTIEHLFTCGHCFETYRCIHRSYHFPR